MSAALEIIGFLLCLVGWAMIGATLPHNYWKVSSIYGSVITTSTLYENLWKSCAEDSTGVSNCRVFDSMFALPGIISGHEGLKSLSQSDLNCCYRPALELARQCCEALCPYWGNNLFFALF
uniref:Claudin n=1 Tax=Anas zonorhyncha TaxID=75864 RepID=A0A8B9VB71_9AVES